MGKKGSSALNAMSAAAVTLVFVGIALGIGTYVQQEIKETGFGTTVNNESVTWTSNNTWQPLDYQAESITLVTNSTKLLVAGTNYDTRVAGQTTQIRLFTNATENSLVWNVTYVAYNEAGALALANASTGLGAMGSWLPIIAVVIAAAFVVGVLIMYFAFGRR